MMFYRDYGPKAKKYRRLKLKYEMLRREYRLALQRPDYFTLKAEQTFMLKGLFIAILFASAAYAVLRLNLMIEFGIIAFFVDIFWELHGTKKGWWKYQKSAIYDIRGRVPIEIPLGIAFGSAFLVALTKFLLWLF